MKKKLLLSVSVAISALFLKAQVTQINSNNSLQIVIQVSSTKTLLYSSIDSSIWVTDATLAGTVQISPTIKWVDDDWGLLNGKVIFRGSTPATGSELFITDGTPGGTALVSDINGGAASSDPSEFVLLNGFLYFSAETATSGRELWRTDGSSAGTTLVKDIVPGIGSSNTDGNYNLTSNGSFLLFAATTAADGNELWRSDGTSGGTILLKDINTGADSSNPNYFTVLNSIILFTATDATHGNEIWKTDGTAGGTVLVKDINPGTDSSTYGTFTVGGFSFASLIFEGFHLFNNHAYFVATDGVSTGELWSTDGTAANTILLQDIIPSTSNNLIFTSDAMNLSNKFIFPVSDGASRSELWQSDGTPGGTVLLKAFSPVNPGPPIIYISLKVNFTDQTVSYPLFQGNKFFFSAGTSTQGTELWVSDGTSAGTNIVDDINPGTGDGIVNNGGEWLYTTDAFFFAADDGTDGNELWRTDGTVANTSMVADIYTGADSSNPQLNFISSLNNGKIIFGATNGDDPNATDLYVVGGTFVALPIKLTDFTVTPENKDALLQWSTQQELNSKSYTIQRSYDGQHFDNIGSVNASGTTYAVSKYSFTDVGIMNSGKQIVYYRLNAIDKDGKSVLTNIISLRISGNSKWSVKLLSNPLQDNVNLLISDVSGKLQLSVRDVSGKLLYTKSMENINGQISLPAPLQKGIYLLEAVNNNERKVIQFIK